MTTQHGFFIDSSRCKEDETFSMRKFSGLALGLVLSVFESPFRDTLIRSPHTLIRINKTYL